MTKELSTVRHSSDPEDQLWHDVLVTSTRMREDGRGHQPFCAEKFNVFPSIIRPPCFGPVLALKMRVPLIVAKFECTKTFFASKLWEIRVSVGEEDGTCSCKISCHLRKNCLGFGLRAPERCLAESRKEDAGSDSTPEDKIDLDINPLLLPSNLWILPHPASSNTRPRSRLLSPTAHHFPNSIEKLKCWSLQTTNLWRLLKCVYRHQTVRVKHFGNNFRYLTTWMYVWMYACTILFN